MIIRVLKVKIAVWSFKTFVYSNSVQTNGKQWFMGFKWLLNKNIDKVDPLWNFCILGWVLRAKLIFVFSKLNVSFKKIKKIKILYLNEMAIGFCT